MKKDDGMKKDDAMANEDGKEAQENTRTRRDRSSKAATR